MIKAIETIYKGYRFRSRLEARWAVVFDALGLDWEYEPEGFQFSDGTRYLPDFYIRNSEWFVEVKPKKELSGKELHKIQLLDSQVIDGGDYPSLGCLITPELREVNPTRYYHDDVDFDQNILFFQRLGMGEDIRKLNKSIKNGKQVRFEYGETTL